MRTPDASIRVHATPSAVRIATGDLAAVRERLIVELRKAVDQLRREGRQKRGGGKARGDSALIDVVGDEPTPEFAAMVAEETELLLERLNPQLRRVALAKLEGYTNQEIAEQLTISEWTVRTHVRNILSKLHLANRTQAALYALREGLANLDYD